MCIGSRRGSCGKLVALSEVGGAYTDSSGRKLLTKRALMCLCWIVIIDVALCCLFIFVPGKRL